MVQTKKNEYALYVAELMQSIGPVYIKGMFGGYGLFLEGLMFALIADNTLYLKADKESESEFTDRSLDTFTYNKKDKVLKMSYFLAPEETLEDSDAMKQWANKAYNAALRAASKKRKK